MAWHSRDLQMDRQQSTGGATLSPARPTTRRRLLPQPHTRHPNREATATPLPAAKHAPVPSKVYPRDWYLLALPHILPPTTASKSTQTATPSHAPERSTSPCEMQLLAPFARFFGISPRAQPSPYAPQGRVRVTSPATLTARRPTSGGRCHPPPPRPSWPSSRPSSFPSEFSLPNPTYRGLSRYGRFSKA